MTRRTKALRNPLGVFVVGFLIALPPAQHFLAGMCVGFGLLMWLMVRQDYRS